MAHQDRAGSRPTIVVVAEDETLIRMTAVEAIAAVGLHVIETTHADEALRILKARASEVRVLFTDVHMPGTMDGLELTRQVLRRWPWIKILIASARHQLAPHELPHGSHFVAKPYDTEYIAKHIRQIVTGDDWSQTE